jgi:hypothetical protein
MTNILTWHTPSSNGAFQKTNELGIFSDMLVVKPTFSFSFTSMNYIEQNGTFDIDGVQMTDAQKAEVLGAINSISAPLEWYRSVKQRQHSDAYQAAIKAIAGNTDSAEMTSWAKQEAEARAYIADTKTLTPILAVLVTARGMNETVADLSAKIIAKADQYATAYASILGVYQAKQKQLEIAATVEQVIAIN